MKIFPRVLAIVLLVLVALMTLARRESSGAWIAYEVREDGRSALFLMTGDGASRRKLTPDDHCGAFPAWSPDGRWIAYLNTCPGTPEVLRMRPGDSAPESISTAVPLGHYVGWSPDGDWLIVRAGEDQNYLVDFNGSVQRLTDKHAGPQWSPDGEWIYARRPTTRLLIRIHVQSGTLEPIRLMDGWFEYAAWSPDGSQIVMGISSDSRGALIVMTPDGSIADAIPINSPFEEVSSPAWSPDGAWIAFRTGLTGEQQIHRIRPDGSDLQRLAVRIEYIYDLQWSPDGDWLLFASDYDRGVSIFRVRAEGSRPEYLTSGRNPQYAPIAGMNWHPLWLIIVTLMLMVIPHTRIFRR